MKAASFLKKLAQKGTKKFNPLGPVLTALDLVGNPRYVSMVRAAKTGAVLADAITRTKENKITLVGHSLGCRVIYYALQSLSVSSVVKIDDVILLGGAVGKEDSVGWKQAAKAINGNIYNCFSTKDQLLSKLYRIANANLSHPIGILPIPGRILKIKNLDCSKFVSGHMNWKQNYETVLRKIY